MNINEILNIYLCSLGAMDFDYNIMKTVQPVDRAIFFCP